MRSPSSLLQQTPNWVWWSFFPAFGGLAIAWAGYKSNTTNWLLLGAGITTAALALSSTHLALLIWLFQIATAFYLKKRYLIKTSAKGLLIPEDRQTAQLMADIHGKIDINNCSKDDLVKALGLPIVYANNIESLQNEGYLFTHLEELHEIAGIPESYLPRLAPLIIFSYDLNKEIDCSWKRLNIFSTEELMRCGLEASVAQKITQERQRRGEYKSVLDVKHRTGIPFQYYRILL
ncbi:MAG: helix-hairpin-helix domain-containing protein [Crinalium sp.]